jgi:hypothetical protein
MRIGKIMVWSLARLLLQVEIVEILLLREAPTMLREEVLETKLILDSRMTQGEDLGVGLIHALMLELIHVVLVAELTIDREVHEVEAVQVLMMPRRTML